MVTKGVTNYKTLLDQIARRPISKDKVCLVTFNYDTLLDEALISRGFRLESMSDYVKGDFQLIKLHGSVNWAHEIRDFQWGGGGPTDMIREIIDKTPSLLVDPGSFDIVPENPFERSLGRPSFPALAIPVENKPGYECAQEHLKALDDFLPHATKVLLIGWHATENRFLKTLAERLPRGAHIMTVSGSESGAVEVINRLSPIMREAKFTGDMSAAKGGFSNFVFSPEASQFLS
jgi:hypothetical protein